MNLADPLTVSIIGNLVLSVALGMLSVHHYHTTISEGDNK